MQSSFLQRVEFQIWNFTIFFLDPLDLTVINFRALVFFSDQANYQLFDPMQCAV